MNSAADWPNAVRGGIGRLLARYGADLAVEDTYLLQLRRHAIVRCVDHTATEIKVPLAHLPLVRRVQERGALLMIDDLQADSVVSEETSATLHGSFLAVGAFDEAGELIGILVAHGLVARSWTNRELERAGDVALGLSSLLILDTLREHAERRLQSEAQARVIRRQMHTISARSAEAASLSELSRVLVRETPALLDAAWAIVGVRHAESKWRVYVAPDRKTEFDVLFDGADAPGVALLEYGASLDAGRDEITTAEVPEWGLIRDSMSDGVERLVGAALSSTNDLSMVLLCGFSSAGGDVRTSHLIDELVEDVRRVVGRTASAQGQIRAAAALQRSLLPPRIPDLDGFEFGRLYNSAADHSRVGGDWYDIVKIDAVTTAFVVGDVAGHDIRSAALMGQLRHVLASQLRDRRRPAGALSATDRYFADLDEKVMATAVVIVVDQSTQTAHVALAGHPPPVLLSADGAAALLRAPPGAPIGFGYGGYVEMARPLVPGDTLIAYTDGVVENRIGNLAELIDSFVDALGSAGRTVQELVGFLDRHSRRGELVDDVAALVVRILAIDEPGDSKIR